METIENTLASNEEMPSGFWAEEIPRIRLNDPTTSARMQMEFDGTYAPGNRVAGESSHRSWFTDVTEVINPYMNATYIAGTDVPNSRPWYDYVAKSREQILQEKISEFKYWLEANYHEEKMIEDIISKNFLSKESQLKIFKEKTKNFRV